jgi:hypothetical protein
MRSSYVYDPHLWPAIFTVAITAFLAVYSWRRRKVPGARPFAIGSLFAMLWGLGTVMEISAQDFSTRVFWVKFETVWQMPTATAIMCFILVYAGLGKWLTRRNLILLAIPPLITMVIVITNDYHHLVWTGFRMGEYIIPSIGGANRFLVGYTYVLALINLIVLLWLAIRSPQHRWPVAIMLIGQIIGRGLYLLNNLYSYFMGPGESLLVVIGLISSTYAIALFRFHVFDPVPAARAVVLEQMREGILVLDLQGRIVDLNPAAEKIFNFPQDGLRGSLVTSILPECSNLLMQPGKTGVLSSEISLGKGI